MSKLSTIGFRLVGGIDFGFRNPFAALWGVIDREGVLWLIGEHYASKKALSFHAEHLPKKVRWYADPSGAGDIAELLRANFKVTKALTNDLRQGIGAVSARIESGMLKVVQGCCPNLIRESNLYRYSDDPFERQTETPHDSHNHAMAALRYLIASLDYGRLARSQHSASDDGDCVGTDSDGRPIDSDGRPLTDRHGNRIEYRKVVTGTPKLALPIDHPALWTKIG
jgi:hypothetical protein